MNTIIVFECVDVSVTLAAAWALLHYVVARPAIGWHALHEVEACPAGAEPEPCDELPAEPDETDTAEDGITWPEPTWLGLAVA